MPTDGPLAYADVCSMWISCDDAEYWEDFRNMITFLRRMAPDPQTWGKLLTGSLLDLLLHGMRFKRTKYERERENAMWLPGEVALTRVSRINWDADEFIRLPVSDLLDPFSPRHQQDLIIADIELLPMILSLAFCGGRSKKQNTAGGI